LPPTAQFAAFKMDLDNFKGVNEALGHSGGDEAIRLYCLIVKRILGKSGEVYRRGGDEVVVFAPGLDGSAARALAEKVRNAVESDFREWGDKKGLSGFPTASIGLALVASQRRKLSGSWMRPSNEPRARGRTASLFYRDALGECDHGRQTGETTCD